MKESTGIKGNRSLPRSFISLAPLLIVLPVLLLAARTTLVLDVRLAEGGTRLSCYEVDVGEKIQYHSINSIFSVPVEETWQVEPDGSIRVVQVDSVAAVIDYYGIETYTVLADSTVRGIPKDRRYAEVRLKAGPRGQQRLSVRGQETSLYLQPEGTSLIIAVRSAPVLLACR